MCKHPSFSKYQKSAIKFVSDYLGAETPFTYQKTQNNHLEFLIQGVEKPIYTSCTPSNGQTLANFKARIKREVGRPRAAITGQHKLSKAIVGNKSPMPMDIRSISDQAFYQKMLNICTKQFRSQLSAIASEEKAQVHAEDSVEWVPQARTERAKLSLASALNGRKNRPFIPSKEKKILEEKLLEHLNFMLPTLAAYTDQLSVPATGGEPSNRQPTEPSATHGDVQTTSPPSVVEPKPTAANEEVSSDAPATVVQSSTAPHKPKVNKAASVAATASDLMAMKTAKRMRSLRALSYPQMEQLIADIQQAMMSNREQDLDQVVALMQEKDVSLSALQERLLSDVEPSFDAEVCHPHLASVV